MSDSGLYSTAPVPIQLLIPSAYCTYASFCPEVPLTPKLFFHHFSYCLLFPISLLSSLPSRGWIVTHSFSPASTLDSYQELLLPGWPCSLQPARPAFWLYVHLPVQAQSAQRDVGTSLAAACLISSFCCYLFVGGDKRRLKQISLLFCHFSFEKLARIFCQSLSQMESMLLFPQGFPSCFHLSILSDSTCYFLTQVHPYLLPSA